MTVSIEASAITQAIAQIVERSRPLGDRLNVRRPDPTPGSDPAGAERLVEWCRLVAKGDREIFEKRLSWDGLDMYDVRRAMTARARHDNSEPLPQWAETFGQAFGDTPSAIAASFNACSRADDRVFDANAPILFEELFLPLIALARRRLDARTGPAYRLLNDGAHRTLERRLLAELSRICGRALYIAFSVERACRPQGALEALFGGLPHRPNELYSQFIGAMRRGRWLAFFEEYPVAARLCATITDAWVDAHAEFLLRLSADLPALQEEFRPSEPLTVVTAIKAGLSDPHQGGRSVLIAQFASGFRIVYKPRPIDVDREFAGWLDWLNDHGGCLPLKPLQSLSRPTHGWIEWVEHRACQSPTEVARFYQRCGMLLCLTYALNGSDFHFENLIACGEHPVLIDLEMLLGPRFQLAERLPGPDLATAAVGRAAIERSVLKVALLPFLKMASDSLAVDFGGMAGMDQGLEAVQVAHWEGVNTDAMRLKYRSIVPKFQGKNQPALGESSVDAAAYVREIIAGFEHTYGLLQSRRCELTSADGLLPRLKGGRVRFIFRHTSLYAAALERCLHPKYLRDGADRSIQFDVLTKPLLMMDERPVVWPVARAEREAMERMDVPFFEADVDSTSLELSSGITIANCFQKSAYDEAFQRLNGLSDTDCARQVELIRGAFAANEGRDLRLGSTTPRPDVGLRHDSTASRQERAIGEAHLIAAALRARALASADGEITWLGASYVPRVRRYDMMPVSASLFDGYGGIALFLSAIDRVAPGHGYREDALAAIRPLRSRRADLQASLRLRHAADLGAATGLGSIVYALVRIAALLDDPLPLAEAQHAAALVTAAAIVEDESFDVASGAAGAILGLLALHNAIGDQAALHHAALCGAHLLDRRTVDPETGLRVWKTRQGLPETGFGHGQAGIAYALSRLHRLTGESSLAEAAAEAIAYERSVLGRDLAGTAAENVTAAWSRGATGIGLARLGMLDGSDDPEIGLEIDAAIAQTQRHLLEGTDTLCCGSMGRIDLLLAAAATLGRPETAALACVSADRVIDRAHRQGGFNTGWAHDYFHPGFFQGVAGIGYELLRVSHPHLFPSVLLWQ